MKVVSAAHSHKAPLSLLFDKVLNAWYLRRFVFHFRNYWCFELTPSIYRDLSTGVFLYS